jgi:hypothetical protein
VAIVKTSFFIQNPFLSIVTHRRNWVCESPLLVSAWKRG